MELEKLKTDNKYKEIFTVTEMELEAIERLALQDGEIYPPLVVWESESILVYGYQYFEILKAHPEIRHTIRQINFADWQEAQVWAMRHYIAQPEVRLWQKLEVVIKHEDYLLLKEQAKEAQGKRTDLRSPGERKLDSAEADVLIGQMVGCSKTYVYYFRSIYFSEKKDLIEQCREGNLSIKAAYERMIPKKHPSAPKPKPGPDTPIELEIDGSKIFDDCENRINMGKKTGRIPPAPVDPSPIIEKIRVTDVPQGAIWIALHKKDGQLQVVSRSYDKDKGIIRAKINAYTCKIISSDDDLIILEAYHLDGSTTEALRKDDRGFSDMQSLAS